MNLENINKRRRGRLEHPRKREAIRLMVETAIPYAEIARRLGIHRNTIMRWRRELLAQDQQK